MMALLVDKAEVGNWPVIGFGVKISGLLLVNKVRRNMIRHAIIKTIQNGRSILVYPEGTPHPRPITIDFKPGTFKITASNGTPIVTESVEFKDPADAFVGNRFNTYFYNRFRNGRCM